MALIEIDPEFEALIPKLSPDEYAQLEKNILREGCLDNLRTWGRWLLDGHNRYRICKQHNIPFGVTPIGITSDDRNGAMSWIEQNQLGRRNLSDDQRAIVLESLRARHAKQMRANQLELARAAKSGSVSETSSDTEQARQKKDSRAALAKEHNVTEWKLRQAQEVTKASPELAAKVRSGDISLAKAKRTIAKPKKIAKGKVQRLTIAVSALEMVLSEIEESNGQCVPGEDTTRLLEAARNLRGDLDILISRLESGQKTKLEDAVVVGGVN